MCAYMYVLVCMCACMCICAYVSCTYKDLLPNLKQGVGFGIYIYKYRGWAKIKVFPLHQNGKTTWHVQTRGWVSQIRDKPGGG